MTRRPLFYWEAPRHADRIDAILRRLSRNRVLPNLEVERIAWLGARRWSGNPNSTYNAVTRGSHYCVGMYRGRWLWRPDARELSPDNAWTEGRQCIAIQRERCRCGNAMRDMGSWNSHECEPCRKERRAIYLLEGRAKEIRSLIRQLDRERIDRYGHENRRIARNADRGNRPGARRQDGCVAGEVDRDARGPGQLVAAGRDQLATRGA